MKEMKHKDCPLQELFSVLSEGPFTKDQHIMLATAKQLLCICANHEQVVDLLFRSIEMDDRIDRIKVLLSIMRMLATCTCSPLTEGFIRQIVKDITEEVHHEETL